eukprot:695267_1
MKFNYHELLHWIMHNSLINYLKISLSLLPHSLSLSFYYRHSYQDNSISRKSRSMKSKAAFVLWAFATVSNALGLDCDHITFNYSKSRSIKFTTTPLNTCTIGQGSDSESEKLQCEASPSAPNGYEVIKYHWTEPGCSGAPANAITVDTAFDTDFNCSTD